MKKNDEVTKRLRVEFPSRGEDSGETRATLTVLAGPQLGRVYELGGERTVLGRGPDCDVRIDQDGVSRRHATIRAVEGRYLLEDADSKNGTSLDERPVTQAVELRPGSRISLGHLAVLRFSLEDRIEREFRERLYEMVTRDPLTGASNRRHFRERLDSEWPWASRHLRPCAVLAMDLDHFKRVNDVFGHAAGDQVLREFVELVVRCVRREDLLGRLGGEEFAVLCRDTAVFGALRAAERIRRQVEAHRFEWEGQRVPLTVSIGIATSLDVGVQGVEALLQRADEALYAAKRGGRNRILAAEALTGEDAASEDRASSGSAAPDGQ